MRVKSNEGEGSSCSKPLLSYATSLKLTAGLLTGSKTRFYIPQE